MAAVEKKMMGSLPDGPLPTDQKVMAAPISIKEMLAKLDGVFPMDEAVVEGDRSLRLRRMNSRSEYCLQPCRRDRRSSRWNDLGPVHGLSPERSLRDKRMVLKSSFFSKYWLALPAAFCSTFCLPMLKCLTEAILGGIW